LRGRASDGASYTLLRDLAEKEAQVLAVCIRTSPRKLSQESEDVLHRKSQMKKGPQCSAGALRVCLLFLVSLACNLLIFSPKGVFAQDNKGATETPLNYAVSSQEKLDYTEKLEKSLQTQLLTLLRSQGDIARESVSLTIHWSWDQELYQKDLQLWKDRGNQTQSANGDALAQSLVQIERFIAQRKPSAPVKESQEKGVVLVPSGERLGPLNLDVLRAERKSIPVSSGVEVNSPNAQPPLLFSLMLPTDSKSPQFQERPQWDVGRYLRSLKIQVAIPVGFESITDAEMTKEMKSALERHVSPKAAQEAEFSIKKTPAKPKDAAKDPAMPNNDQALKKEGWRGFMKDFLLPSSPALASLLGAIPVALALALCALFLFMGGKSVASSLGKVATAQENMNKKDGDGGGDRPLEIPSASAPVPTDAGASKLPSDSKSSKYDSIAEANAVLQEMLPLRQQAQKSKEEDPLALAEVFGNLLCTPSGADQFRQMAAFLGEEFMESLLKHLNRSQNLIVSSILLEKRHDATSLLAGAETTRMCLSHWTQRRSEMQNLLPSQDSRMARSILLTTEDKTLQKCLEEKRHAPVAAWVMKALTTDRLLMLIKSFSPEVAKPLLEALDSNFSDEATLAREVSQWLQPFATEDRSSTQKRLRIIRLMANQVGFDEEPLLESLLDGPDWDARLHIAQRCYFISDLEFVSSSLLRSQLEALRVQDRALVAYLLPLGARTALLEAYPENSKAREALTLDLQLIDSNPKKQAAAKANRKQLLQAFVHPLRNRLAAQPQELQKSMVALAKARGWQAPPGWEEAVSSFQEEHTRKTDVTKISNSAA
jgi:hypothetical protein